MDDGLDGARPRSASPLADADAIAVLARLSTATFRWTAATDALAWSRHAGLVLGLPEDRLPATGRALQRLLTPESSHLRAVSVPPVGGATIATAPLTPYRVVYELRAPDDAGRPRRIVETGRWMAQADGTLVSAEGRIELQDRGADAARAQVEAIHPATGLLLRDSLLSGLDSAIRRLVQDRQGAAAFLVIAVDDLSRINANFGYEVGDSLIATVARRIAGRMRVGDILGHMSGHKFGAVLHNCSEASVTAAAERFRSAVNGELVATLDAEIQAGISIGAVVMPRHAGDAATAAIRAEEALADARAEGTTGHRIYHPSPDRDRQRRGNLEMAEEIVRGLAEDRFVLAYQPVVDAASRRIVSYEALARLIRDDGSVISAGPLISMAERIGLVRRIDLRTLVLALADLSANPKLRLSVNVSVATLNDRLWLTSLVDAIAADRSIAGRLTIEITETAAMRDTAEMTRMAQMLRDIGTKVAIDDFGSGHTSFKALREVEIDWLKIDGSFVRDIATNPDSAMFVRTLSSLAKHFQMHTVAEWVQDEAAAAMLADFGIDALQGRLTGEPMLRVTDLSRAAIERIATIPLQEDDGYPSFAGLLDGPLGIGAAETAAPKGFISPAPAGRGGAASLRAAT